MNAVASGGASPIPFEELIEVAEAKTAAINAAYDTVMRERKDMALEGAA